ncbi:GDSL esterase/lipase At1g29670-like [Hordeum vulgare subsp. vulgare]|uniref:GDSL esterase/lipase n=1 Tax=Hordeum vulgare subsp. vulgare TaxID=112509 RepID=A0A8I6Z6F5_HORVV|nr:GDSL esterase/lipase At1g29670-like [Hordeum vulgare subsp. vulgare]
MVWLLPASSQLVSPAMAMPKLAAVMASLYLLIVLTRCDAAAAGAGGSTSCHGGRAVGRSGGGGRGRPIVKAVFVFGSSLVDNGNNNFLNSTGVRADYLPYGVDFPLGPSGRFSNGRNTIDALGELLRLPRGGRIPPFADPATRGRAALHGVNFASGGSGILDSTGQDTGKVLSLKQQISNFEAVTLPDLGATTASTHHQMKGHDFLHDCFLPKTLFVIGTGGNDYLLNYYRPRSTTRPQLSDFTRSLITKLSAHLQRLYALGARKFVIFSIQPMGCTPVVRASLNVTGAGCVEPVNGAALLFNGELRSLVDAAGPRMPGASFAVVDSYKIIKDLLDHPREHGIRETYRACCSEMGSSGVLCRKGGPICRDRTKYVFFDGLHPTDVVNARIARKGFGSESPRDAYPINVKKLAML